MNPVNKDLFNSNTVAVIPCYRVEGEIGEVISNLPTYLKHVIFIDDASPDHTAEILKKASEKEAF